MIILIWVDDLILCTSCIERMNNIKNILCDNFKMKDLGAVNNFLGMKIVQGKDCIEMDQSTYVNKLLKRFDMANSKPRSTPCEQSTSFKVAKPVTDSPRKYRMIVGSLIYAMSCTRPDLCYIVTRLSQHLDNPTDEDWILINHVLRYLKGTVNYKLCYTKSKGGLSLYGYTDSDLGSSIDDRRSTSGFYFSLNSCGPPISWKTKKQPTVALSSCEAEYISLAGALQEAIFLNMTLNFIVKQSSVKIYMDNQGAIALSKNNIIHNRSKHIDIKYHFIREKVDDGFLELEYVPSESNVSDLMTKPCSKVKLSKFMKLLFGERC